MDTKIKNYLGMAIIAALFLSVIAGFWYINSFSRSVSPVRSFSASGEGKVVTIPDVSQFSFGVLTEGGKNLADLQKENTEKVNLVITFLKENGIDGKDIKTQFYNIIPRYQYFSCPPAKEEITPCPPSEIVGYTINQNVSVKIRELNKTGDIMAGVVEKGVNTISGPNFTVDDPTELQNQARIEAITEAKEKAQVIAKVGGFRLGKLLSIQEGISFPPPIPVPMYESSAKGRDLTGPDIEPGSQEISVNATLIYEIR